MVTSDSSRPKLPRPSRRDILFGGVLAGAAGVAFWGMPHQRQMEIGPGQLDRIVPAQVGAWRFQSQSGLVLPPPDQLARLLYDQQVTRAYLAPNALPVMLLMAYGSSQSGMLQVHRPEICYPASGFRLSDTRPFDIATGDGHHIPGRTFSAMSDTRNERVLYWTRIGNALPTGWWDQRAAVMKANLAGTVPDGLLVRLSTISTQEDVALATLTAFAQAMFHAVGARGRTMLIGQGSGR